APRAFAESGQRDHRRDADRHAEERQEGPQPVAGERAEGEAEEIGGGHRPLLAGGRAEGPGSLSPGQRPGLGGRPPLTPPVMLRLTPPPPAPPADSGSAPRPSRRGGGRRGRRPGR